MSDFASREGMAYMSFTAYSDVTFTKKIDSGGPFNVMINPETFDTTLSVRTASDKASRSGNSSGTDAGIEAERYSFDLMFDGTGVVTDPGKSTQALADIFREFLSVVYARPASPGTKKKANFVEMTYCGETFNCKLESMTIKYQLFHTDGNPLRIKATCKFVSVEKPGPDDKKDKTSSKKKPVPPVTKETPNCECVCPNVSYDETLSSARENDSASLMTCNYSRAEMTPNYTPAR